MNISVNYSVEIYNRSNGNPPLYYVATAVIELLYTFLVKENCAQLSQKLENLKKSRELLGVFLSNFGEMFQILNIKIL